MKINKKRMFFLSLLMWSPLYATTVEEGLLFSRAKLAADILELTQAERAVDLEIIYRIETKVMPFVARKDYVEGLWNSLKNHLHNLSDRLRFLSTKITYQKNKSLFSF
jgi:hypothetical protein